MNRLKTDATYSSTLDAPSGRKTADEGANALVSRLSRRRRRSSSDDGENRREAPTVETKSVRKPSYLARREEKQCLEEEIRVLEARLELLKKRKGMLTRADKKSVEATKRQNDEIVEAIHTNLLRIDGVQSLAAWHLHNRPVEPMSTFIHLTKDMAERQSTLRTIRADKFRRAIDLVRERMRFLDESEPYITEERHASDDGGYRCRRFDIQQFKGIQSVKQLYDAVLFYFANMEISITETLGDLTIRETIDCVDPQIWNHHLVSSTVHGVAVEMNMVNFTEYHDKYAPLGNQAFGVIVVDTVDVDELHPYVPSTRVRRDVVGAITVSSCRRKGSGELIGVLKRCLFLKLHPPAFPLVRETSEELRANISTWDNVMSSFLAEKLDPNNAEKTEMPRGKRRE